MTRIVCFSRSIERKSSLFANICLLIDDENSVIISETQEYLVLVISGYFFFCNFPGQFGFLCERVCDFVITFTVNVVNSFQSMFDSNTFSGFLLDWNERGWIVIQQGNLTSDYHIFFLLTFEEITDLFFVFNSMYR